MVPYQPIEVSKEDQNRFEDDYIKAQIKACNSLKNQSVKQTIGKLKLSTVPSSLVREVAKVREHSINSKYPDREGWRTVNPSEYKEAIYRHILDIMDGENLDKESGLPHAAHIACNAAFILELEKNNNV